MSKPSRGGRTTDRSIVTAWVVLVASLVALVALFDWAFVHVVGLSASPVSRTETVGPVSGVHGTATGSDVRGAPVLEGSASKAAASASTGEVVTEPAAGSPADVDGELAVVETPDAATAEVGDPTVEAVENVVVEAVEGTSVGTTEGALVEVVENASAGAVEDTSVEAIEVVPVEVADGAAEDAPSGVAEDRPVEAAGGGVVEERAEGNTVADASSDDVAAVGDAIPYTDAVGEPTNDTAAEEPADAARKAAATPFPEAAAALPEDVDSDRPSTANGANIDDDADAGVDADADLEALRRLLAEAAAIEAAIEPFGEGTEASEERTESGDGTSRPAPATALDDLAEAIRFEPRSATLGRDATTALDELAALLANRPDLTVTVGVTVDEFGDDTRDRMLGRERGRAVIVELVARGVAFERLSLSTDGGGASSPGSHRVRIVADTDG